jgi:hypothetical protein
LRPEVGYSFDREVWRERLMVHDGGAWT